MKFINKFYLLLLLMNFTVYIHREQECPKYEIKKHDSTEGYKLLWDTDHAEKRKKET